MSTFKADYLIARQEELNGNTSSIPVKTVVNGTPKSWVNFNGTSTIATRASFNVSSLTDNGGTGDYTVNFSDALFDANYSLAGTCQYTTSTNAFALGIGGNLGAAGGYVYSTTSCRIFTFNTPSGSLYDCSIVNVQFFR